MRTAGVALVALLAVGVAACGDTEGGRPTAAVPPDNTTSTTPEQATTTTTAESGGGESPLAQLDPCAIVPASEFTDRGFTRPGRRDDLLDLLRCVWPEPGRSARVLFAPQTAMGDTNNGRATKVEDVTIGSHVGRLVQEAGGAGSCEYDLIVTDSSHATVAVQVNGDTAQACQLAQQLVTIVEPKLP